MQREENLIPYHAADLTGNRVLVLAPHPDDETIGCGGSIALHRAADDPVKVVFLTDGSRGDFSACFEEEAYARMRRDEARKACDCLGVTDIEFWPYNDRSLSGTRGVLTRLAQLLEDYLPDLVYAPSPLEFHPDHRAAALLLADGIRGLDRKLKLVFYEVNQPLSVNLLVDITPVLERKIEALRAYQSQLKEKPYMDLGIALNRFRSLTLPENVTHAEGFSAWDAEVIRKSHLFSIPFQNLHRLKPEAHETGPLVSVIVRTKDRPALLGDALKSIACQTYANLEIIVVNDGGEDCRELVEAFAEGIPFRYVPHESSRGRAAALNSGVQNSRGAYLSFLDDDDIYYPNAIEVLASTAAQTDRPVVYGRVVCREWRSGGASDTREPQSVKAVLGEPFQFGKLILENFIPTNSLLVSRRIFDQAGLFDGSFEIFEDWEWLVRVSGVCEPFFVDALVAEYRIFSSNTFTGRGGEKLHRFYREKLLAKHLDKVSAGDFIDHVQRVVDRIVIEKDGLIMDLKKLGHHVKDEENGRLLDENSRLLDENGPLLDENERLVEENRRLSEENRLLSRTLEDIHSSHSWKITSPVRRLGTALKDFRKLSK